MSSVRSEKEKKEGLGLDVKGGEVEVRITDWCGHMNNQADRQNTERNHRKVKGEDSIRDSCSLQKKSH